MFTKIKDLQNNMGQLLLQLKDLQVVALVVFLAVVLLVSWSSVRTIETNYGLQKQISQLNQENRVKRLANENLKLQNQYLNSGEYLELSARHDFGLAAPGETVLNVPRVVALAHTVDMSGAEAASAPAGQIIRQPWYQRNFQAWMDFFLHRNR